MLTNNQTNGPKTICSRSIDVGGIKSLLKTLREKKKMLVTCFKLKKSFYFDMSKILSCGIELTTDHSSFLNMSIFRVTCCNFDITLSQMTNFRLFQTEGICSRQFQICCEWQKVLQMSRKHCGKWRNCSLRAISPFPTMCFQDLYCRHIKPGLISERVKGQWFNESSTVIYIKYNMAERGIFL